MPTPEVLISRLVLWNIDLTLIDVDRITRRSEEHTSELQSLV